MVVIRDPENENCSVIGEDLIVQGNITGDITTDDLLVEGYVHGMIQSDNVELKEGCKLEGDIAVQTLAMDHGAAFNGSVLPLKKHNSSLPVVNEAAE